MDSTVNSVRGWPHNTHKQISNGLQLYIKNKFIKILNMWTQLYNLSVFIKIFSLIYFIKNIIGIWIKIKYTD